MYEIYELSADGSLFKAIYLNVVYITDIKGLWSLLGEHVENLLGVRDSVGNS